MATERTLSREARLVLGCARTRIDAETRRMVSDLLNEGLDWLLVARFALQHRVVPLLHHGFASLHVDAIPTSLMDALRCYSETITANNHARTRALLEVLDALAREGIPAIPFKGPILALSAYGRLTLRQFRDLDVLVHEHDVVGARRVLGMLGYGEIRKKLTWETEFRHADTHIDLHWRFAPARMVDYWIGFDFDLEGAWCRVETMSVLGHDVTCFAPEDALLALCQSSLKNGFNRSLAHLRWVCDIAELIRAHPDLAWDTLMARAHAARSHRALSICIDLAHTLLGAPAPDEILRAIRKDPVSGFLRRRITYRYVGIDPWRPVALADQYLYAGLAQDRLADRLPYVKRCITGLIEPNERDRDFIRLPDGLQRLYYVVRPVRLCVAQLSRALRHRGSH